MGVLNFTKARIKAGRVGDGGYDDAPNKWVGNDGVNEVIYKEQSKAEANPRMAQLVKESDEI